MKYQEFLEQMAGETGLRLDNGHNMLFGSKSGYGVTVVPNPQQKKQFIIWVSVSKDGQMPDRKQLRTVAKEHKQIALCGGDKYAVSFLLKAVNNQAKCIQLVKESLDIVTAFLRENGYVSCCQSCGAAEGTEAYAVGETTRHLCAACAEKLESASDKVEQETMMTSENTLAGIVGALLGSVLGAAVIILLSRLGYVAALSGIVMAVCTLKGYELLGKKMSVKGIVICCVIMLGMTYVADRFDWAIVIAQELETDVFTGFRALPLLLEEEIIEMSDYFTSLFMVYAFTLIGAVWQVIAYAKGMKMKTGRGVEKLSGTRQIAEL